MGLSKHQIEFVYGIPRCYWNRWAKGQKITKSVQARLREEVQVPESIFIQAREAAVACVITFIILSPMLLPGGAV
jgi:hypothetical protein